MCVKQEECETAQRASVQSDEQVGSKAVIQDVHQRDTFQSMASIKILVQPCGILPVSHIFSLLKHNCHWELIMRHFFFQLVPECTYIFKRI